MQDARAEEGRHGAEAKLTTHKLMAKSGHKTLAMVQLYTDEANKNCLPTAARRRSARRARRHDHQREDYTLAPEGTEADQNLQTLPIQTYKHGLK